MINISRIKPSENTNLVFCGDSVQVSVEVMDVLMKYGTAGVAGLVLRREFVEAVDVLKRLSGVDK